jgi:hypothetical protein
MALRPGTGQDCSSMDLTDNGTSGSRAPGRPRRTASRRTAAWRTAAPAVALVTIAGLAAACGGGASTPAGHSNFDIALAYARCMRTHGDLNWPDPNSQGQFVKTKSDSAAFQAPASAYRDCQHLLPNGGQLTTAEQNAVTPLMLKFTGCMRSHGILNFPDPIVNAQGAVFDPPKGLDPNSPQVTAARHACQKYQRAAAKYFPPG